MPKAPFNLNRSGLLLALVSAAFASNAGAAAGRTEFVIGGVTVARNGVERPLTRGAELDNGDTVRTSSNGRAQIRFTDGAYVSLQPNTEYSIRDYRYDGAGGGEERGFFGLLKGAMRTVTGAIGRLNRTAYRITTPTATVGIRGTGGVIQVLDDGSTLVVGTSGIWSLSNPAGSVDVPAGTSALAPTDPNQPPQETTQQPTSGPAPVPEEPVEFVAGNEVDEQGLPVIPEPSFTPLVSGSGYAAALAFGDQNGSVNIDGGEFTSGPFDAVFNPAGQLTALTNASGGVWKLEGGTHADFGSDGILAWGRWTGTVTVTASSCDGPCAPQQATFGPDQGFHYVIGMPTAQMPTQGTATYSLLGATRPTYTDGGIGQVTSGSLAVAFGSGSYDIQLVNFGISMPGATYRLDASANISFSGAHFSFNEGVSVTPGGNACLNSSCFASVEGFFAGTNAERAGIAYFVLDFGLSRDLTGAAAFKKD